MSLESGVCLQMFWNHLSRLWFESNIWIQMSWNQRFWNHMQPTHFFNQMLIFSTNNKMKKASKFELILWPSSFSFIRPKRWFISPPFLINKVFCLLFLIVDIMLIKYWYASQRASPYYRLFLGFCIMIR